MAENPIVIPFAKPRRDGASPQQFANPSRSSVTFRIGSSRFAIAIDSTIRSLPPEPAFAAEHTRIIPIQVAAERMPSRPAISGRRDQGA